MSIDVYHFLVYFGPRKVEPKLANVRTINSLLGAFLGAVAPSPAESSVWDHVWSIFGPKASILEIFSFNVGGFWCQSEVFTPPNVPPILMANATAADPQKQTLLVTMASINFVNFKILSRRHPDTFKRLRSFKIPDEIRHRAACRVRTSIAEMPLKRMWHRQMIHCIIPSINGHNYDIEPPLHGTVAVRAQAP